MRTPLYDRHEHACALALSPFRALILPELLRLKMSRIRSLSWSPQKRGVAAELMLGGHREGRTMVMNKLSYLDRAPRNSVEFEFSRRSEGTPCR